MQLRYLSPLHDDSVCTKKLSHCVCAKAPRTMLTPQPKSIDEQAHCITSLTAGHLYSAAWWGAWRKDGLLSSGEGAFAIPGAISWLKLLPHRDFVLNYLPCRYSVLQRMEVPQMFVWESSSSQKVIVTRTYPKGDIPLILLLTLTHNYRISKHVWELQSLGKSCWSGCLIRWWSVSP